MIPTEGKNEAQPFTTGFPIFSSSCRTKKHTLITKNFGQFTFRTKGCPKFRLSEIFNSPNECNLLSTLAFQANLDPLCPLITHLYKNCKKLEANLSRVPEPPTWPEGHLPTLWHYLWRTSSHESSVTPEAH